MFDSLSVKLIIHNSYSQDFQKEIVKAAEALTAIGYKHIEAGRNLLDSVTLYDTMENVW
jgi:hypothetical protein